MNNNIVVNMKFTADTAQAKKQMESLQNSLTKIMNMSQTSAGQGVGKILARDLSEGQQAAAQLQASLRQAFNVNTGKLDLGKFTQSMRNSNMSIEKYRQALANLGPTGQAAFSKMAESIATAEVPVFRLTQGMQRLLATFANTARYQLSSNIITGFTSGIQDAFDYAQRLNESLNNIRIVTGYNTDQMKDFAVQANKAAKALSTTTTAYTDASLIFFQQGLTGDAVKERADVVVKLANVTGQSAEIVSDQMTAIWNNFDNGSKSMEYYADVITKLGAATASSTDEISDGLEKFAAVAETVGLSYEMATAALATVTSETRQSADVVGTAFKTIFSRMEGLKLGETLDDGTTLNQYSQALATAGVNIKGQNDQLKDMDDILNELGAKWNTMNKDTQIALAQSVAGVRQYNQFIALMSNWDKVQSNLDVAVNSTGELNAQADIYAESWAAAKDRVKASLESIYNDIVDDEFFIKLTNFGAELIDIVNDIIDSLGGIEGVVSMLGALFTKIFSKNIVNAINNVSLSFMSLTKKGREYYENQRREALDGTVKNLAFSGSKKITKESIMYQQDLQKAMQNLTDLEREQYEIIIDKNKQRREELRLADEAAKKALKNRDKDWRSVGFDDGGLKVNKLSRGSGDGGKRNNEEEAGYRAIQQTAQELGVDFNRGSFKTGGVEDKVARKNALSVSQSLINKGADLQTRATYYQESGSVMDTEDISMRKNTKDTQAALIEQEAVLENQKEYMSDFYEDKENPIVQVYDKYIKKIKETIAINQELLDIEKEIDKAQKNGDKDSVNKLKEKAKNTKGKREAALEEANEIKDEYSEEINKLQQEAEDNFQGAAMMGASAQADRAKEDAIAAGEGLADLSEKNREVVNGMAEMDQKIDDINNRPITLGDKIAATVTAVSSLSMAISSVKSIIDVWNNQDMTFGEKLTSIFTSLAMILPMVTSALNANNLATMMGITYTKGMTAAEIANQIQTKGSGVARLTLAGITKVLTAAKGGETASVWANSAAWYANPIMWIALVIIGVIAAIAGLIAIIINLNNSFSDAAKNKALEENIKGLQDQADKTKESVENLKNAWSGWDDAYNTLASLKKGTLEWNEALLKSNQAAMELLDTYPQLAEYMTTDANGAITFGEGAQEMINKAMSDQLTRAQVTSNLASSLSRDQQIEKKDKEISNMFSGASAGEYWATMGGGAAFGAALGTVIAPGLGSLIGAGVGALAGPLVQGIVDTNRRDARTSVRDAIKNEEEIGSYEEFLDKFSSELEGTSEAFKKDLYNTAQEAEKAMYENKLAIIENNKLLVANNKALASNILATQEGFSSLDYQEQQATINLTAAKMAEQQNKLDNTINEALTGKGADAGTADNIKYDEFKAIMGLSDEELAERGIFGDSDLKKGLVKGGSDVGTNAGYLVAEKYIKMMTESGQWQSGDAINYFEKGKDGEKVKINVTDSEGNIETKTLSLTEMMTAVGAEALAKQAQDFAKQSQEAISKLTDAQIMAVQGADGVAGMTKDEFNSLFTNLGIQSGNAEGRWSSFKINASDEELKTMAAAAGYIGEDAVEQFTAALLKQAEAWDEAKAAQIRYDRVLEQTNAQLETAAQETGFSAKTLKAFTKQIEENAEAYSLSVEGEVKNNAELRKSATTLAIAYAKMQKGLAAVSEAMEDNANVIKAWKNDAKEGDLPGLHVLEAASSISDALSTAFGVDVDPQFVIDNLELVEAAMAGVEGKGKELTDAINQSYLDALAAGTSAQQELRNLLAEDFQMGQLNTDDFVTKANQMIAEGKTTAEEVNKALRAIGYEAEVETATLHTNTLTAYPKYEQSGNTWTPSGVEYIETNTESQVQFLKPKNSTTENTFDTNPKSKGDTKEYSYTLSGSGGENTFNAVPTRDIVEPALKDNASKNASSKENKDHKKFEEEEDRYHTINQLIDRQARNLDKLDRAKQKASGSALVDILQQEQVELQKESDLLEQKSQEIKDYLSQDINAVKGLGIGANIENGVITNYNDLVKNAVDEYNAAVDKYNQSDKGTAATKALEEAEDRYDEIIRVLNQYESTYEEHLQNVDDLADKELQIWEKQWEAYEEIQNQKMESWERMTSYFDSQTEYLDRKLGDLEDKEFSQAEAMSIYSQKMAVELNKATENQNAYIDALAAWKDAEDGFVTDENGNTIALTDEKRQQLWDNLTKAEQAVADSTDAIQEIQENIDGLVIDHLDDQTEAFDRAGAELEHYNGLLDQYNNIIDLAGARVDDSELRNDIAAAQVQNAQARITAARTELDLVNAEIESAREMGVDDETMNALLDRQRELQNDLMSSWADGLEAAANQYRVAIEGAIKDAQAQLLKNSPYKTIDQAREAFDQKQEIDNLHVDEYEKLYKLSKLTRDINKSMNENGSLVANQKLSKLLDEVNEKREKGVEMTEYELESLQRQYDLKLAEIALEEAQGAKDSMRLVRNSSGNWSYVYSANQENIDKAHQQYEDALYAIEDAADEYLDTLQEQILDNYAEMYEALAAIRVEDYANYEEYEAALERTKEYYLTRNQHYYDQIGFTIEDLNRTYDDSAQKYGGYYNTLGQTLGTSQTNHQNYSTTVGGLVDGITGKYDIQKKSFTDLALAEVTGIQTIEQGIETFEGNVEQLFMDASANFAVYLETQEDVTAEAGKDLDKLKENITEDIGEITTKTNTLVNTTLPGIKTAAEGAFGGMLTAIQTFNTNYAKQVEETVRQNGLIEQSYQDIVKAQIAAGQSNGTTIYNSGETPNTKPNADNTTGSDGSDVSNLKPEQNAPKVETKPAVQTTSATKSATQVKTTTYSVKSFGTTSEGNTGTILLKNNDTGAEKWYYTSDLNVSNTRQNDQITLSDLGAKSAYNSQGTHEVLTSIDKKSKVQEVKTIGNRTYYKIDGKWYQQGSGIYTNKGVKDIQVGTWVGIKANNLKNGKDNLDDFYEKLKFGTYKVGLFGEKIQLYDKDGNAYTYDWDRDKNTQITRNDAMDGVWNVSEGYITGYSEDLKNGKRLYKIEGAKFGENKKSPDSGKPVYVSQTDANCLLGYSNYKDRQIYNSHNLKPFDTGGYTGEWGPEGKLAVLHEKELVLNKDQTSDFLGSLELMAHIIDVIDRNSMLAVAGLAIGGASAAAITEKVIQQTVSIEANFPGVTSAVEIEEALNSIINDAVQYTSRDGWEG